MDNRIKNALGILSSLVLLAALIISLGYANDKFIKPDQERTISMSAEGKITAKPDMANVSFSVVTQGKDAAAVQKDNDAKMTRLVNFLKGKGVAEDDIKTSGYNLNPQYDYSQPNTSPKITGYTLTQQVAVKMRNLDNVQSVVGSLTSEGANQIDTVNYFIDDPDALRGQAREQAIEKAKAKAEDLAKNLGIRLGKVVNFSEGSSFPFPPGIPGLPYAERSLDSALSPIQSGTQDVIVNVTVIFELK